MEFKIRQAVADDVYAINIIEQATSPEPWSEQALLNDIVSNENAIVLVAEADGKIIAYSDTWKVADELQLCNIAVLEEYRGNHIASEMLSVIADIGNELGCKTITLEVRESNDPAINLYVRKGFKKVGKRESYYIDTNEAAILMDKDIK